MKKHLPAPVLLFFLTYSAFFISACSSPVAEPDVEEEEAFSSKQLPHEWMYAQRAYPNNHIDQTAINEAYRITQKARNDAQFRSGEWELAGPTNVGGRITDIALHPTNQDIIYVGTSVGGLFRSTDGGEDWTAVFEDEGGMSIGNIAIAPSNPDILYIGSGEANGSAVSGAFFGDGVYKSTDGGDSWSFIGLENTQHIGRIVVDPQNPDRVYVAAAGVLYGKNEERGLYRTLDGGENWQKILYVSDSTSCIDVVVNPNNASIVYAATWERIRRPWGRSYGGKTSRIYRSFDGGNNWEKLTNGLPPDNDESGRIGLAISPSEPNVLYASYTKNVITNEFNGVYKSVDAGTTWSRVDQTDIGWVYSSFGWFFGNIRVHPQNSDDVSLLGVYLIRSLNGGKVWQDATFNMHVDFHALEFHPQNPSFLVAGNDGGVYVSHNGGFDWQHIKGIANNLIYNCEIDHLQPERIYAGFQDQGTQRTLTGAADDFQKILGGDGFRIIVDPTDNNYIYAETQYGRLYRSTNGGNNFSCIFCSPGEFPNLRSNWNTPIAMHPSDPTVIYYGAQMLFKGTNRGNNFAPISGDLTDGLHPSGSLSYGTITTIALAPSTPFTIYVGTDDGNVHVTHDGGNSWDNISHTLPDRYVTSIAVHPFDKKTAYVTLSGYREIDYQPHILKTLNGGENWEDISANLPEIPINDVVVHPSYPNLLFIANDMGVWHSVNGGNTWGIVGNNLPFTVVNDLDLHEEGKFLLAATFGRSMHKYDITELEPVSSADRFSNNASLTIYPNPASVSATVSFVAPATANGTLQVLQINGKIVQTIGNQRFNKGKNEISINVSGLPSGNYLVRLKTENGIATGKLIK